MKKVLLVFIFILAFGLRLYRIDNPIADWHSWRQADTSAVSRNFVKGGFDIFHPRFDDLSNVASGFDNPEGYRFVEFPLYNLFQALAFKIFPFFSLEVWGRLVAIGFSLGSLGFLYLIAKKYLDEKTALWTALFYAVLPFNIYYSRTILPEPMMVAASLAMIYFFDKQRYFWAMIWAMVALLLKPYTLVFLLPIVCLAWQQWRFDLKKWLKLALGILVCLLPFIAWRMWMKQFPEGIPVYDWLFNEAGIRLKGAFFWWLFAERLGKLILGGWGLVLFGLGLALKRSQKEGWFFLSWLAAILAYLVIMAGGNVKHDYYQLLVIPIICVFLAKGSQFLFQPPKDFFSRITSHLLLITCILFMLAFSWYQVRDFFNINNPLIAKAGQAADRLLPKDAKVIAPLGGDTAFLYQTNRQGWPIGIIIEELIEKGAEYYVNVNFGPESQWVVGTWCLLEKEDDWLIVDLTKKCPGGL